MKKYFLCLSILLLVGIFAVVQAEEYVVGEGDILRIRVYDHPDLESTVRVSGAGTIVLPLLGEIEVRGLSVSKVTQRVSQLLADGYIVNPQVSVFVEEFRSKKVIILGQVEKPGLYELRGITTFLELISKAGGLTNDAGDQASIKRRPAAGGQDEKILTIDMKQLVEQGDTLLNISIQDGDTIYISKAGLYYVTGEVKKPDAYKFESTSVIKAITKAGGLTDKASARNVKIIRKVLGEEVVLEKVAMDEPVQPDDVIVVPESFF